MSFLEQQGGQIPEKAAFRKEGERPKNQQTGRQVKSKGQGISGQGWETWTDERGARDPPKGQVVQLRAAHLLQTGTGQGALAQPPRG